MLLPLALRLRLPERRSDAFLRRVLPRARAASSAAVEAREAGREALRGRWPSTMELPRCEASQSSVKRLPVRRGASMAESWAAVKGAGAGVGWRWWWWWWLPSTAARSGGAAAILGASVVLGVSYSGDADAIAGAGWEWDREHTGRSMQEAASQ